MKREWLYFWGLMEDKTFFHFARFKHGEKSYSHLSINDTFYEGDWVAGKYFFTTPFLKLGAEPISPHIIHFNSPSYYYYSIPFVEGVARCGWKKQGADVWMDYEATEEDHLEDWEWVAVKLSSKIALMVYKRKKNSFGKLMLGDHQISSSFTLTPSSLSLPEVGFSCEIKPLRDEVVFTPSNGRPYSEQPFEAVANGKVIGYGVRERTYQHGGLR